MSPSFTCYSYRPAAKLFRAFPFTQSLYEYETPSGTLINSTDCVRDLGVHMSSDFTWSAHISTIAEAGKKNRHQLLGLRMKFKTLFRGDFYLLLFFNMSKQFLAPGGLNAECVQVIVM